MFVEVIGNGGGSFASNYQKYESDIANEYRWEGDTTTGFTSKADEGLTLKEALSLRDWDYIIFHQASRYSGNIDSFSPYLDNYILAAKTNCPNEHVKIVLMQTWAYADIVLQDSGTPMFPTTSTTDPVFQSQNSMYEAICNTYKQALVQYADDVSFVIPCGTAIQNARTTLLGSTYNDFGAGENDGSHINSVGTLITSLTALSKLLGIKLSNVTNNYSSLLNDSEFGLAVISAKNAIKLPWQTVSV